MERDEINVLNGLLDRPSNKYIGLADLVENQYSVINFFGK